MRAALWLVALFAVAAAVALMAGDNQHVVTLFWPPYRVDLSVNFVALLLLTLFAGLYLALRAMAMLMEMPKQAQRWRAQQRERDAHVALLDAIGHLLAGRFLRARKAALTVLAREKSLAASGGPLAHAGQLRALAHLVVAESAQSLQDKASRDEHLHQALELTGHRSSPAEREIHEGTVLRAARWSLDDRDVKGSLAWLDALPQGAQRRTLALRVRLKAARLARQTRVALETAQLLAKHRAFPADAAQTLIRSLLRTLIQDARDPAQLQSVWEGLGIADRKLPEIACDAALRLVELDGDKALARAWLLPVWDVNVKEPLALSERQRVRLVQALERALAGDDDVTDRDWLARIEAAQQAQPRDAALQYLAGIACMRRQLWGKAQQLLTQAAAGLQDPVLKASAWRTLAELAEHRDDPSAAALAWRRAAGG